jgi:serine/threonine protein phosphatase 1
MSRGWRWPDPLPPGRPRPVADAVTGLQLAPPFPTIYAVGDLHGRLDLYREMESRILHDPAPGAKLLLLLGDVLDRGPDSAALVDHLLAAPPEGLARHCLMGNHEDMALRFLDDPDPQSNWLWQGGAATLASYGLDWPAAAQLGPRQRASLLAAHVPAAHRQFLASLPTFLRAGPLFFSHAGADPALPLAAQQRQALLWSRSYLDKSLPAPPDLPPGGLVVQGHVPLLAPERRGWRVNVDTGAVFSGRLSAIRLQPDAEAEFWVLSGTHDPANAPLTAAKQLELTRFRC